MPCAVRNYALTIFNEKDVCGLWSFSMTGRCRHTGWLTKFGEKRTKRRGTEDSRKDLLGDFIK